MSYLVIYHCCWFFCVKNWKKCFGWKYIYRLKVCCKKIFFINLLIQTCTDISLSRFVFYILFHETPKTSNSNQKVIKIFINIYLSSFAQKSKTSRNLQKSTVLWFMKCMQYYFWYAIILSWQRNKFIFTNYSYVFIDEYDLKRWKSIFKNAQINGPR